MHASLRSLLSLITVGALLIALGDASPGRAWSDAPQAAPPPAGLPLSEPLSSGLPRVTLPSAESTEAEFVTDDLAQRHDMQTQQWKKRLPRWWETQQPVLERTPGYNLYWHDPYLGWTEHCRSWPPETLGCSPLFYGKVDALMLARDVGDKVALATLDAGGPVVLSTSSFDDEFQTGVRALIGCSLGDWLRVEFSYFGSYSWGDDAFVRNLDPNILLGIGNLFSPFSDFGDPIGVPGLDYNDFASVHFSSKLDSGELNFRRRVLMRPGCYETSFFAGVRYLDIEDDFTYFTQSTTPGPAVSSNETAVEASNQLWGPQIGMTAQFLVRPRCWIDFELRGGIFNNHARQSTLLTRVDNNGATTLFPGEASHDRTSFAGDISLQLNRQFSKSLTFYLGYNAYWITGLALGPRNFNPDLNVLQLGPAVLDHRGEIVYHGPNIGLVFAR